MDRSKNLEKELPDCVVSYIFSKLRMKDLVKTSILSKRWLNEWGSRMDLNFDLNNMFDSNGPQKLDSFFNYSCDRSQETIRLLNGVQSEFARRVDQFMLHYQGAKIHSLKVDFPLDNRQHDIIDAWISQGIAKGVERIELLFSDTAGTDFLVGSYKFSCNFLSGSDSLKYMHLQNCLLVPPTIDLSGLQNLRTLVLHEVFAVKNMLADLFSNCIQLVDLTLINCKVYSDLNITNPAMRHLNIVDNSREAYFWKLKIDIFTLNLSSFKYVGAQRTINIMAPLLSKFSFSSNGLPMPPIEFSRLKNLRTIELYLLCAPDDLLPCLFSECLQLEELTLKRCTSMSDINIISPTLLHLNIFEFGYGRHPFPWKIDIDTLNLLSFEYRGHLMYISSIKAPRLLKIYWDPARNDEMPCAFDLIASLQRLENLTMVIRYSQIFPRGLAPFQYLKQLDFFFMGACQPNEDFFWILDIIMAFPCLQKLFLTTRYSNLVAYERQRRAVAYHRQRREHVGFSHNELKYVELRGCAGNINEIELASHFLKNVSSLKQITFGPCGRLYIGAGKWTKGFHDRNWFLRGRHCIQEMLKDEVNEQCQLVIL